MRLVLVALASLVLSACSMFMRSIEKPQASVRDVQVSAAGFSGVSGELHLDVTNPNSFGVPLAGIAWELSLGGARAVTGNVTLNQTIPAKGVAPVATSLSIDARDAIAVASALGGGARDYRIRAKLTFSTAIGPVDVQVEHAGQLGRAGGMLGQLR